MFTGEQCQTDLASLKMYIGMADGCDETDLRWRERIVGWYLDGEQPKTATVGRGLVAGTFEDCFPAEEVLVAGGAKVKNSVTRVVAEITNLVRETLERAGSAGSSIDGRARVPWTCRSSRRSA